MTRQEPTDAPAEQATISLPIPPPDASLVRHKATDDILQLLVDNPYERFTPDG